MTEKTLQYQTMRIAMELEHTIDVLSNIKNLIEDMNQDLVT